MGLDAIKRLKQLGADLMGQAGPAVGVDFGIGALKMLQVRPNEPPSLMAAACVETPFELMLDDAKRLDFQIAALGKMIKDARFSGRRVVCSIPASQTWCKHLQLPKTDSIPMGEQVMAAVSAQLGCDPSALVYRHVEVEGAMTVSGKTEVICMATPREFIKHLVSGLKDQRLEPVGMHSEFAAAIRSFESVNRRAADQTKTTLYLDLGGGSSKVVIAHGASMVFARTVDVGGRLFDETIVRQTKWDIHEARAARFRLENICPSRNRPAAGPAASQLPGMALLAAGMRSGGAEPVATAVAAAAPSTPEPDLSEPLEVLTDEILLSLRYHESLFPGRKVERVIFLGGESKSRSLCQMIARALKLPAQLSDPLARVARSGDEPTIGVDLKQPQPGWAVALGLAISPTDL
jgi:Tfp pilus assembly PilM family ATPase